MPIKFQSLVFQNWKLIQNNACFIFIWTLSQLKSYTSRKCIHVRIALLCWFVSSMFPFLSTICICENKDADQLCSNCTADQRLCFRYTDSTIPLLLKYEKSSFYVAFCDCTGPVRKPHCWFSHGAVQSQIMPIENHYKTEKVVEPTFLRCQFVDIMMGNHVAMFTFLACFLGYVTCSTKRGLAVAPYSYLCEDFKAFPNITWWYVHLFLSNV